MIPPRLRRQRRLLVLTAVLALVAPSGQAARAVEVLTAAPRCANPARVESISVDGTGFVPGQALTVDLLVTPKPPIVSVVVSSSGTFSAVFPWAGRPGGSYQVFISRPGSGGTYLVEVPGSCATTTTQSGSTTSSSTTSSSTTSSSTSSSSTTSSTSTTSTSVPAGALTLVCIPPIGPPGFVTQAVGTGFPPNTAIELTWQPGIGGAQTVTDAMGNLSVPVLVMHRDVLGLRNLVARAGTAPDAPTASAPFLVVPATLGPPEVSGLTPQLVFRR